MHGWTGTIVRIDLTEKTFSVEHPSSDIYERFIGGRGMAGHYLMRDGTSAWDDPAMPLLLFTGPLVDTPTPTSGRMCVMSRSPLTGAICDTSVGGRLGTQLKRAGYDGVVIAGKSDAPCGIEIRDGAITFTDAAHLRGKTVSETRAAIGDAGSCAVIGPAAENGVLYASIMVDGHFCSGRGGLGLVMASKNLKYLTVGGTGKTQVADRDEIAAAREEINRLAAASPILLGELGIAHYGTGALYDLMDSRRMMPTDNFRATHFAAAASMNAHAYKTRYATKRTGCTGCAILCKKIGANKEIIPEFETMSHFSALIGNVDPDAVVEANRVCNEAGMDTITAAVTIACHLEITGRSLAPGALIELLNDIAHARGDGAPLAMGSYRYAAAQGRPEASISVKKMELPAYDPRGAYGMALAYAVSTRGACHLRAYPISHELLRKPVATDRFSWSGKARIIKIAEDANATIDSLTACKFLFFAASLEEYARAYCGATGARATAQDLLAAGERIYYTERVMNAANGFTADDDDLPPRFFAEPGTGGGGIAIAPLDRGEFLAARARYYRIRGLDGRGMPTEEKCRELGIEWNG